MARDLEVALAVAPLGPHEQLAAGALPGPGLRADAVDGRACALGVDEPTAVRLLADQG